MVSDFSVFNLVVVFVSLVISITVHEAMHAYSSHWLGDDTAYHEGRITLNPFKHVDLFSTVLLPLITLILFKVPLLAAKPVPFNPNRVKYDEFGVAIIGFAGPLTNALLAGLGALIINVLQGSLGVDALTALIIFVQVNIGLFIFNLIPIPPLDGSRVLYAFAPEPLQRIMAQLEQFGIFIVFALVLMVPAFTDALVNLNNAVFRALF
jgi:Zn-dependent protease